MLKYLVPKIALHDLPVMLGFAFLGALIAGAYGIVHDHITFTIGPEYFTKLKFEQFGWANIHQGERVFVSCIGFLATWWVGLIVGWVLARRLVPNQHLPTARRKILNGFMVVFVTGFVFGIGGYLYGLFRGVDADYSDWEFALRRFEIDDIWSFVRVAYIHNAGYLGGLIGLVLTFFLVKPSPTKTLDRDGPRTTEQLVS